MGWLTMPLSSMHPYASPKAYLDGQFTYDRRDDAGKGRALRIIASSCQRNRSCPSTWCNFRCATGPHRSGGLGCNL
jgi:hypothetical protein